jgi:hypothetical protein
MMGEIYDDYGWIEKNPNQCKFLFCKQEGKGTKCNLNLVDLELPSPLLVD